jgi:pectate lyase
MRLNAIRILSTLPVLLGVALAAPEPKHVPAFPGAEGYGAFAVGGRNGRVLFVNNLNDSGAGSFRAACEAAGPRIVVFTVSGTIALRRPIVVRNPFLTIAGQTAPGDGICLRNYPFKVATHDVVVRFIRSRLGDETAVEDDCLDFDHEARNSIFDHCSATWSIDECLSLSGNTAGLTIQWCLIGESLNASKHHKGPHGFGSLSRANGPVTWHHNLWIHNNARNPRLGDNYGKAPYPTFDVRNNVIYDFGATASGLTQGKLHVNYVGNYLRSGPSSTAKTPITVGAPSELLYYIRDNIYEGHDDFTADNSLFFSPVEIKGVRQVSVVAEPFATVPVKTTSAQQALEDVLASVGASLPKRDAVDARLVNDVRNRTGHLIDSQSSVGGWPELTSAPAPLDSDHDGMPDVWEKAHGLNPNDASDANGDRDGDGYTNIEEYLNSLAVASE